VAIVGAGPSGLTATHVLPLDTLIVAVAEKPEVERIRSATSEGVDITTTEWGSIAADPRTREAGRCLRCGLDCDGDAGAKAASDTRSLGAPTS